MQFLAPGKYAIEIEKPAERLDLVWIGSSSTRKYFLTAMPAVKRLEDCFPPLRLKKAADFKLPSQHLHIVPIPWSEDIESEALSSAHIGIAPMPDNLWTWGQMWAQGLAVHGRRPACSLVTCERKWGDCGTRSNWFPRRKSRRMASGHRETCA